MRHSLRNRGLDPLDTSKFMFHNVLISPGMTATDGQNPGFTLFKLSIDQQLAYDLKWVFLSLEKTYN
jgi:hypothetical protein